MRQYPASGPLQYVRDLFMAVGMNAHTASLQAAAFYGPMFLFYSCYDGAGTVVQKQEVKKAFGVHLERMRNTI